MSELHIPVESVEALYTAADRIEGDQYDEPSVRAIATPVVVAELASVLSEVQRAHVAQMDSGYGQSAGLLQVMRYIETRLRQLETACSGTANSHGATGNSQAASGFRP